MKKRNGKSRLGFLLILAVLAVLCLSGCGAESTPAAEEAADETAAAPVEEKSSGSSGYTVTVLDDSGSPVSGAQVQICTDSACLTGKSGEDGRCEFKLEPGVYEIHILKTPEGFEPDGETVLQTSAEETEIKVTLKKTA